MGLSWGCEALRSITHEANSLGTAFCPRLDFLQEPRCLLTYCATKQPTSLPHPKPPFLADTEPWADEGLEDGRMEGGALPSAAQRPRSPCRSSRAGTFLPLKTQCFLGLSAMLTVPIPLLCGLGICFSFYSQSSVLREMKSVSSMFVSHPLFT